jgi:uncharacterized protein (DUF488 family)
MQSAIFTIGHSTHPQERFIELLQQHRITALCDIRSTPFSQWNPQFNRRELEEALMSQKIAYRFRGKELGARSEDPACYKNGKIQYDRLAATVEFRHGIRRLVNGIKQGLRIVIMCAEREPLDCHRSILVARYLVAEGLDVQHIHANGQLESHSAAMDRLEKQLNGLEADMFLSREELMEEAYRRQGNRIAYELNDEDEDRRAVG